jgi:hypothetical protein
MSKQRYTPEFKEEAVRTISRDVNVAAPRRPTDRALRFKLMHQPEAIGRDC